MAYPESCFTNLIGIRGTCETPETMYLLDLIPGMDLAKLAATADAGAPTGAQVAQQLIEAAATFMIADVEAIYDGVYKVENTLINGCSSCKFTTNSASGSQRGTLTKSLVSSTMSRLVINSFVAKVLATGTFTIILDDGIGQTKQLTTDFVNGEELEFQNVNFKTRSKEVRIYLQESGVPLAQLACPSGSGCGCSGKAASVGDLTFSGTAGGVATSQAYGFLPCAMVTCDAQDLLCYVANSAPRMIGMALLYKTAELYFQRTALSTRHNNVVGVATEQKVDEATKYGKLYLDKLNGKSTRGVKDLVNTTLQQTADQCVVCNSKLATAWAV